MGQTWKKEKSKEQKEKEQMKQDLENTQAALMELAATLATTQTIGGK